MKKSELEAIKTNAIKYIAEVEKDMGCCVLGDGIYIFNGKRNIILFDHYELTEFQGDLSACIADKPVIDWLNENHPKLKSYFDNGIID